MMLGTGILGEAVSGQHSRYNSAPDPLLPLVQPSPGRLTSAARRAGAALGTPAPTLATAAVFKGEGGPSQGARTHAVLSTLGPAHVPTLRGAVCGRGPGQGEA